MSHHTVNPLKRSVVYAACAVFAAGCDSPGPAGESDEPIMLELVPIVRFGTLDGPTELQFTTAYASLEVDPARGEVYVAEPQAREIRGFSTDGEFLRRFGRSGAGPGEFGQGPTFAVARDSVMASGTLVGRLDLPPDFVPQWISPTEIWGFEVDEFDVPYVMGYRLRRFGRTSVLHQPVSPYGWRSQVVDGHAQHVVTADFGGPETPGQAHVAPVGSGAVEHEPGLDHLTGVVGQVPPLRESRYPQIAGRGGR